MRFRVRGALKRVEEEKTSFPREGLLLFINKFKNIMSWFSEITSKAEAMLVKLDQDAAQALQNPDNLLRGNKIIEKTIDTINPNRSRTLQEAVVQEEPLIGDIRNEPLQEERIATSQDVGEIEPIREISLEDNSEQNKIDFKLNDILEKTMIQDDTIESNNRANKNTHIRANGVANSKTKRQQTPVTKPAADDIRASIKRSLEEYNLLSQPSNNNNHQTPYSSHFDSQPLLATTSSQSQADNNHYHPNDHYLKANSLTTSSSFSIDFPDDRLDGRSPASRNNMASRYFKQTALKRRSSFSLQSVISRLARQTGNSNLRMIGNQMRLGLARTQRTMGSYARQLNYYFRAYPRMKYVALVYMVLLQLLVVYVLLFYQSNNPTGDLSKQVKQQQEDLLNPSTNSENNLHSKQSLHSVSL